MWIFIFKMLSYFFNSSRFIVTPKLVSTVSFHSPNHNHCSWWNKGSQLLGIRLFRDCFVVLLFCFVLRWIPFLDSFFCFWHIGFFGVQFRRSKSCSASGFSGLHTNVLASGWWIRLGYGTNIRRNSEWLCVVQPCRITLLSDFRGSTWCQWREWQHRQANSHEYHGSR